ncbi:putative bifunctional diguanylate cyclase/phosphodiesterase [Halomonas getboli]|uniref:putative bifunctional diguanylate cyclase/phosphodiesterase n=1 Tax=Halomonas getboli TaxID=2935862 RepID=UPI001FFFEB13|nr:EAL domain-containing protein [Halomonas getboli]MCK2182928.1 EAL domain-containing protein [Halomonas getboli]
MMGIGSDARAGSQLLACLSSAAETADGRHDGRDDILALIEHLFGRAPILLDGFDARGRCILWNRQCEATFGWTADEIMAHPDPLSLFYPDAAEYQSVAAGLSSHDGSMFQEWTPTTRDGRRLTILWANVALPGGDMICLGHDITQQRQAENQRRLAASVFESSSDAILITDAERRICDINSAFTRISGFSREEVLGLTPDMLGAAHHDTETYEAICQHLDHQNHWKGEVIGQRRNGDDYPLQLSVSVVRDALGQVLHYVATFADITHLKRHQDELHYLARHDALTELPNRRHFAEKLVEALPKARHDDTLLAICFLDLDGFKPINDTLGHAAGDQVLVTISQRLRNALRADDILARLGGDEFALLLTGLKDRHEGMQIVERIRRLINQPMPLDDTLVRISTSIGVTLFPHDDAEAEILLRHADQAMYRAKHSGKNRYSLFDPALRQEAHRSRRRLDRLEQAFRDDELVLYYQPRVDLRSGKACGLEALLRWQHPERGLLEPSDFLPQLLGSRLETPLGDWVIERVLVQLDHWQRQDLSLRISFNASANHLALPEFTDRLGAALSQHPGLNGQLLEIEFQESAALEDLDAITRSLRRCREAGLTISLDDFGTGYSSLSHLRELPIDTLKIDQRFVGTLLADDRDAALVQGIIQLGEWLGLDVVAEGAETPAHCRRLRQLGCPMAQGYAIARPMPAAQVIPWLAAHASGRAPPAS